MKLIVTEKQDAAQKIAKLLGTKVKQDKVYTTPVYKFFIGNQEYITIGLRGHILSPDFPEKIIYKKTSGWNGIDDNNKKIKAHIPRSFDKPPYKYKRKPYLKDGIDLKSWKMEALPYLVYSPIQKTAKEKAIIRSLKNLAKKSETAIIATDFDREGELIGADALNCILEVNPNIKVFRARYSAFTKEEITEAFNNLVNLDKNLAFAGETRQDIDLIWGAVLTRYLTLVRFAGYGNVRSSGRVQTPTLALVVDKERERNAHIPVKYWVIDASFGDCSSIETNWNLDDSKNTLQPGAFKGIYETNKIKEKNIADNIMHNISSSKVGIVTNTEKKQRTVKAPIPFNTTSLMAAASREGLSPARTMRIAESLYMSGYISYPRVDNTVYPKSLDLKDAVRKLSKNPIYYEYCNKLLKEPYLKATRGSKETTDHPPIYPTSSATSDNLSPAEYKLYNLIARRFLATLSEDAIIVGTKISISVNNEIFIAKGDILQKKGFREIYPYGLKKDEQLPPLSKGDQISFNGARCTEKQTEPPARYSQGRLIQQMEKLGLGTKSTRHSIIERLYTVKYIQNDPIEPTQLGIAVCTALEKFAPHITNHKMTSQLEEEMDNIADGNLTKDDVVNDSRNKLYNELDNLIPHATEIGESLTDAVAADAYVGKCPSCGKDLQIKASAKTKSMFIGCSGWPECNITYPLPKGKIEALKTNCDCCGMPQIKVTAFRQKPYTLCINPECITNKEDNIDVGICPNCKEKGLHKKLYAQKNPKTLKRFIRCENYEECETGYPLPQYGEIQATGEFCKDCNAPIVIINTQRGPWKICPNFSCPSKSKDKKTSSKNRKK